MKKKTKAFLMMMFACLIWAFVYGITKISLNYTTPGLLTSLTFIIATLIFSIKYKIKFKSFKKEAIFLGILLGLTTVIFSYGMLYLSEAEGAIYESLTIPFIPIILVFMREKIKVKNITASLIAFLGILLINFVGFSLDFRLGSLLGIFSSIGFALHVILSTKYLKDIKLPELITHQMFFASISSLTFSLIFEKASLILDFKLVISVLFIGFCLNYFSYLLLFEAEEILSADEIGVLHAGVPLFGILVAVVFFKNNINIQELIGTLMIVAAIIIINLNFENEDNIKRGMRNENN